MRYVDECAVGQGWFVKISALALAIVFCLSLGASVNAATPDSNSGIGVTTVGSPDEFSTDPTSGDPVTQLDFIKWFG